MSPQHLSRLGTRGVKLALLLSAICVVCVTALVFTARSRAQEREFKNTIPAHVPIKVKLKNEQKFKKLDNADWARDLEVEIKNTGAKPIYFLYMVVVMPEMTNEYGHALSFQFHYGRKALVSFGEEVLPEDVPIPPGESVTLKVSETQLRGFEQIRHKEKTDKPKKVEFDLQLINYGDRTGFQGKDGTPRSFPKKERGQYAPDPKQGAACPPQTARAVSTSGRPFAATYSLMPASLTRAIFFPAVAVSSAEPEPAARDLCGCQNRSDCSWGTIGCATCPCDDPCQFFHWAPAGGCSNPFGSCRQTVTRRPTCPTEFNGPQECAFQEDIAACALTDPPLPEETPTPPPTPPPTETPTPEPTPVPTCDPDKKPNETNCACPPPPVWVPEANWECRCAIDENGTAANYRLYPSNLGCPPDTFNNGNDCCVCNTPTGACPTPTPTPPPPRGCYGGGALGSPPPGDAAGDTPTTSLAPGPGPGGCGCDSAERTGCYSGGGEWSETSCSCVSPVLVDVEGDGFALTDGAGGVRFDITADGLPDRISWTAAGADDAWLALDRDGNGSVDSGAELFGNFTPQPSPPAGAERNGFLALAVLDKSENGGNGDGVIDGRDAVFASLRLWRDANHDGESQPAELFTLPALDVVGLHLDYKESKRTDEHGNRFRYRAKVRDARGAKVNRWAWDVFLTRAP